jgi:hypothetical protein
MDEISIEVTDKKMSGAGIPLPDRIQNPWQKCSRRGSLLRKDVSWARSGYLSEGYIFSELSA